MTRNDSSWTPKVTPGRRCAIRAMRRWRFKKHLARWEVEIFLHLNTRWCSTDVNVGFLNHLL